MQLFLFFPFYNMFRSQPDIIRYLNLSKLLYCIACHSIISHVTAIFHDIYDVDTILLTLAELPYAVIYFLLKFINNSLKLKKNS
jgi:hypothetical protein